VFGLMSGRPIKLVLFFQQKNRINNENDGQYYARRNAVLLDYRTDPGDIVNKAVSKQKKRLC